MTAAAAKGAALPPGTLPKGLSRVQAAAYIGVGVSKFDEMVKDRRMPPAKRIDGRIVWDRLAIDAAFEALPDDGEDAGTNPWDAAL